MALLPYGCGVNRSGRDGGVRLVKHLRARSGRPQSTSKLVLLDDSRRIQSRRSIWGSARQYYAQAVASTGVSPTVCTTRTAEGGNVTPNAIGPSAQINRNSLPSREQTQIPPIHIDAETSYYSSRASYSRSILAHRPAYTHHHTKPSPLLPLSHHIRSTTFVKPLLPTHAHVRRHHSYQDVLTNNNEILIRAQGDTWRDLVIRNSPIRTLNDQHLYQQFCVNPFTMSAPQPQKEQPGSPELAPPPSEFSLGGVKSNLDTLVRGNKPESLNIEKDGTAKSEEELRKRSGIMSPSITINEKEEEFIGSVDQGTTSSRFIIFNSQGEPVASHQLEFNNIYPQSGWHEHDPKELIGSVLECIDGAVKKFEAEGYKANQIKAIGITTQRETTLCWDKNTGEALNNAVVWPDTRTGKLVHELRERDGSEKLMDICGLPISTYPSSVKLMWMLEHVPAIKKAYEDGSLAFGTVDSWLIYQLNGGKEHDVHVTDSTNASRTMFMNIHTLQYDDELLDFFKIDKNKIKLPKIVRSSDKEAFGQVRTGALKGTPIMGCLGDQSAALVGQCAFKKGMAKNTYGTGCFLLYNVGEKPVISDNGLLATVGYHFGDTPIYALEGSIAVAGSGVKFLSKNLGFIEKSGEIEGLAKTVPDNGGVVFVTAFSGLFAPYWIDDAKGTLFGITAHTQRGHIARATLEATCYQTQAILLAMREDSDTPLKALAVDGGMSDSDLCMQTQADIIGIPVERPAMRETTALGAAIAAGLAAGIWKNTEELQGWRNRQNDVFQPKIKARQSEQMFRRWERAVEMSKGWVASEEEERQAALRAAESAVGDEDDEDTPRQIDWKRERESFSIMRLERHERDRRMTQERRESRRISREAGMNERAEVLKTLSKMNLQV